MKLSVWGLGYVGTVSAACLAQEGHEVIGVDSEQRKVDLISAGKSPIIEKDIGRIIEQQVAAGRLTATMDATAVVQQTDLFLVCVGTPSRGNGDIELKYARRVCEQIGSALRDHQGARLMTRRIDEVLDHADTIVIGNAAPEFRDVPRRLTDEQTVIDFVRITVSRSVSGDYEGICW